MKARRARLLVIATIALALLGPLVLYAAAQQSELGGKIRAGETIVIAAGETVAGDLYVFGGTIRVNGQIEGDLVAFGGQVEVTGNVGGDLIAGAGTVFVTGDVAGDARVGAGQVTVAGDVGEDIFVGSGTLSVAGGSSVGEDLIFSAGQVTVDGAVAGSILGSAGEYTRTGTVSGTENVSVGDVPGPQEPRQPGPLDRSVAAFQQWAVIVIFGALALWLIPSRLRAAEQAVRARPGASALGGLLAFVAFIAALIALILVMVLIAIAAGVAGLGALVGIDIVLGLLLCGLVILGFIVASGFLAHAVVGFALARLVMKTAGDRWLELALLAIGSAVVVVASTPPVIGGIVSLVVAILGLGALFVIAREAWSARSAPSRITPVA